MFYELLYPLHDEFIFFNVFRYITFRAFGGLLTSLFIYLIFGRWFISKLHKWQLTQWIREEGPESHKAKRGTPTLGGVLLVASVAISTLLWGNLRNLSILSAVIVLILFALIGLADDLLKIRSAGNLGLKGRSKFLLQTIVAAAFAIWLWKVVGIDTHLYVPFFKTIHPDLGIWYILLSILVITGASNAVNLTDGLDGLATVPAIVAFAAFALFSYATGHVRIADYLQIPFFPAAGELAIFCSCIVGAGIGFLWYNTYPAEIFMGDVGSLPLGASLGLVGLFTKNELLLLIVGGIFVIETLSVITQVISFKTTGRRIFRMAPIHHHFELKGWPEPKVIVRFWIISFILAMVALATLKLR